MSEDFIRNDAESKDFCDKNKFINFFRSSAKLGININEAMEYLIKSIITRLENCTFDALLENDKKSIILTNQKNVIEKQKKCC